ncbi:hypothetical protein ALI144C_03405 [Actinosynnema sp. ALI-1.44]|uniref:hypothetical protein n=1 Tax=Actinosynnema sp. ALI-1.44 TaxID=1933779 RepID=UPI00097C4971|nr:hypothetical protein [Actinosynnema sp. ALI-1.44]ONI90085.1 hypothetical protein ALI144C_03405 [Actinosynnema sp. ALI-1.44]
MWSLPPLDPDGAGGRTAPWWKGLRAALSVLGAIAAVRGNHEALAEVARALIAVGDAIVDAGRPRRS